MPAKSILLTAAMLVVVGCSRAPFGESPSTDSDVVMTTSTDGAVTTVSLKVPNMH